MSVISFTRDFFHSPEFLTLDNIALAAYGFYLVVCGLGFLMFWRARGARRLPGLILLLESLAAAALMTLMSSHYWVSGGEGIIGLRLRPLAETSASVLLPLLAGMLAAAAVWVCLRRLANSPARAWSAVLFTLVLPAIFIASSAELVTLTDLGRQSRPQLPDPQQGNIKITEGFTVTVFSRRPAQNPTSLAVGPDQRLYVADFNGDIWAYSLDADHDEAPVRYATGLNEPVGLTWRDHTLFVAQEGTVTTIQDRDGHAGDWRDIITGLPSRLYPWHSNNGITFGPDGRMYFAVGSTSDWTPETRPYAASVLSARPDGSDLRVVATGVRNPYRLAFNAAGDLFATDNGPDNLTITPEDKLFQIVAGADYGFGRYIDQPPPGSASLGPVAVFPPHASADGLIFYHGTQFPKEYDDNAFVTLFHRGEIYRVQLARSATGAYLAKSSMFASGFLNPLDMVVAPDGSIYLVEFTDSAIYRIAAEAVVTRP